jgi:hypothetical protein
VQSSFERLSAAAITLNAASDELGKSIAKFDSALKKLNLGVAAWVAFSGGNDPNDPNGSSYWSEEIGYAKVGGSWGIALRSISGDYEWPDQESCNQWLFNDAPRSLRIASIGKLPELLDNLTKEAEATTGRINGKLQQAEALAAAINMKPPQPAPQRR